VNVIDMHNHYIAPEVIDHLARDGSHYATRIVERDGRRFFLIKETAIRPIDGPISNASAHALPTWIARASQRKRYRASRP
jgi:hypothetical protein